MIKVSRAGIEPTTAACQPADTTTRPRWLMQTTLGKVLYSAVTVGDKRKIIKMSSSGIEPTTSACQPDDTTTRPRWLMQTTLGIVLYSKETVGDKNDSSAYIESMLNQRVFRQKFWQPFHLACFRWEFFLAFAIATNIDAPGSF